MIRKLKIQLAAKEKELHRTRPGSAWQRIRLERKALRLALEMARQERDSIGQRSNLKHGCDHPRAERAVA